MSEEDPNVSSAPGLRYLQRSRNPIVASRFHVRECVEHRGLVIEIGRDPPAGVVIAERIQADMCFARKWVSTTSGVSGRLGASARFIPLRQ